MSQANTQKTSDSLLELVSIDPEGKELPDTNEKSFNGENAGIEHHKSEASIRHEALYYFYRDLYQMSEYYWKLSETFSSPCRLLLKIKSDDGMNSLDISKIVVDAPTLPENHSGIKLKNIDSIPFFLRSIDEILKIRRNEISERKLSLPDFPCLEHQVLDSNNTIINSYLLDHVFQYFDDILKRFE